MVSISDLANMQFPVRFTCVGLGELIVEPMTPKFNDWARAGFADARWDDAAAMTRDLLIDMAKTADQEVRLSPETVLDLTRDALDDAANRFLDNSGTMLTPNYLAEGLGPRRKVRRRGDNEAYPMAAQHDETGSERLRRVVSDWQQDQEDRNEHFAINVLPPVSAIEKAVANHKTLSAMLRPPLSLLDQEVRKYERLGVLAGYRSPLTDPAIPKFKAIRAISAYQDQLAERMRIGGAFERLDSVGRLSKSLGGALPDWAMSAAGLGRHASILNSMAALPGISAVGAIDRLVGARLESVTRLGRIYDDQFAFLKAANRTFNLGLTATTIAALTMSQVPDVGAVPRALGEVMAMPAGFQMATSLGLSGITARGVTADLLQHYDETPLEGEVGKEFSSLQDSVHRVDEGTLDNSTIDELIALIREALSGRLLTGVDPVHRAGRLEIFTTILAILAFAMSGYNLSVDMESRDIAKASFALDQTATEVLPNSADLGHKLDLLHEDLTALKADALSSETSLRFVHKEVPLRAEPDAKGLLIRVIYPDQPVRILDERDAWVKVEVHDYRTGRPVVGWMSRRHLRNKPML